MEPDRENASDTESALDTDAALSLSEAAWTWARIALLSFGGPAGQIAVMHRILVDEKKWISEERFVHALNYCTLLPGPEAQQLATYIGWLFHRLPGGLIAGTLFILPGILSILVLSVVYVEYQQTPIVQALFFGMKPAVMAIVMEAVLRIGKRILKSRAMLMIAAAAFVSIFALRVPFPLVVLGAGLLGMIAGRRQWPGFVIVGGHGGAASGSERALSDRFLMRTPAPTWSRALRISAVCLTLWWSPVIAVYLGLGKDSVFVHEGLLFSKSAVVTFGGAYSVLAYIQQQAVEHFGWLQPAEMLDGLGMAETTPGPLIMVVQFVGFLGAYRNPGPFSPMTAAIIGSLLTTWVTFVPCFYWIFLGAPYVERLRANRDWAAALSAITAAVVGVILNLAITFSFHTLYRPESDWLVDGRALAIAVCAMMMTFYWKRGLLVTLVTCCLLGVLARV